MVSVHTSFPCGDVPPLSITPASQLIMAIPTFAEVEADLEALPPTSSYQCIFTGARNKCRTDISPEHVRPDLAALERDVEPTDAEDNRRRVRRVRDAIGQLLCDSHKGKISIVVTAWAPEFPKLNFSIDARRSRSSLPSAHSVSQASPSSCVSARRPVATQAASGNDLLTHLEPPGVGTAQTGRRRAASEGNVLDLDHHQQRAVLDPQPNDLPGENALTVHRMRSASNAPLAEAIEILDDVDAVRAEPNQPTDANMQQPPAPALAQTCARSARFEHGKGYSWTPWRIRTAVRACLLERLPDKTGTVYIIPDFQNRYVKIGMTEQAFEKKRLTALVRDHPHILNEGGAVYVTGIELFLVQRLEQLVHQDLAFFQRLLQGDKQQRHHEWFEIPLKRAEETVRLWRDILRALNLKPGGKLEAEVRQRLLNSQYFRPWSNHCDDFEASWRVTNADHGQRDLLWRTLLLGGREASPQL